MHGDVASLLAVAVACLATFGAGRAEAVASSRTRIDALIRDAVAHRGIKAAIMQATVRGRPVITRANGESMTGVPATPRMHFRNGAVAISYMSTLLLRLVDEGKVGLDRHDRRLPRLRARPRC